MSIGANIRKRRFELRMSQQELAYILGYKTRSTIAKIESGENDITQKKLQRFADALDTTVEALLSGIPADTSKGISKENIVNPDTLDISRPDTSPRPTRPRTVAIILAGGKSCRNLQNIPSQFIHILGKPVIIYYLEAYQAHPSIDDIYIVCLKGWEQIMMTYVQQYGISKLKGLIPAAASGILSVKNGLNYVQDLYSDDDIIIFQESNRPMVSVDMISKLLQACYEYGNANICAPMKDYSLYLYKDMKVTSLDREHTVSRQSPEAYRFSFIRTAFKKAQELNHPLTENGCTMLLYNLGMDINFIEGSAYNVKIIHQEDIAIFEALARSRFHDYPVNEHHS